MKAITRQLIQDIPGFLMPGQEHLLYELANQIPHQGVIVEVGSFLGKSTVALALGASDKNPKIYAIDMFKGNSTDFKNRLNNLQWEGESFLNEFKSNLKKADITTVEPIQGHSHDIGSNWNKGIDLLFLDGSHDFEDIKKDYELFSPWVKPGGIIALHDVAPEWKGPYKIWNDCIKHELKYPKHFFSLAYGMKKSEMLHIIIPVHNTIDHTIGCLKSLYTSTVIDKCIINVVDDGSTDGTSQRIMRDFPDVNIIKGDGTLYWTGAVATALGQLKTKFVSGDHFCLINNDVRLSPETLEVLLDNHKKLGKNSCIAPAAYNNEDAESTGWGPGSVNILRNLSNEVKHFKNKDYMEVNALFGRCSLFPCDILETINNYDSNTFPHYHGDTDFCLRAKRAGFRFFVTGSTTLAVVVDHKTTGTHHEFRKGPQKWKDVWNNMTSIRSIDNVRYFYRFANRHQPKIKYRGVMNTIWTSISNWTPIYYFRKLIRKIIFIFSSWTPIYNSTPIYYLRKLIRGIIIIKNRGVINTIKKEIIFFMYRGTTSIYNSTPNYYFRKLIRKIIFTFLNSTPIYYLRKLKPRTNLRKLKREMIFILRGKIK